MNESCSNCGAELFERQQFCRQCGAPTRNLSSGEMPTQIFSGGRPSQPTTPQQAAQRPFSSTTPLASRDTDSVYHSSFAAQYQTPAGVPAAFPTETAQLQRKRHKWRGWLIAILCLVVFFGAGSFFVAQVIVDRVRHRIVVHKETSARGIPAIPAMPAMPAIPDMDEASTEGLSPLDEAGAQVSGDKTVFTKTFALRPDAAFSLQQIRGDVTIEGWDQNQAQVTITKRGGDAEERAGVEIMHAVNDKGLTLHSPEEMDELKEIKYEIKLPRALRQIEINSLESNVTLSNLAGSVAIKTMKGDFSIKGLTGTVDLRTMKGDISVDLKSATPAQSQSYNTVKGDITLALEGANAQVQAETVTGSVSADEGLGVNIEKQFAGSRASGPVGKGGQTVAAKTVSGSIKIKK
ncbi:MAG: hypothetical protein QOE33_2233 [Acidobacteriota bacterium]|nr:hypothetical protein [Acidobacteriota bacterium]